MPPIELRKIAFEEFLRRLREEEPPKPSTKIRTQDHATSTDVARKRQTEPPALAKQMRGDLDSIALKALEKDRVAPLRFALRFRGGHWAVPEERSGAGGPAFGGLPRAQVRAALPRGPGHCLRFRPGADRGGRLSASGRAYARTGKRPSAQAVNDFLQNDVLAQASAANQSGPSAKPDPRPEGANGLGPGGSPDRGKVRPATGGGGVPFGTPSGRRTWTSGCTRRHASNWSGRWICTAGCWGRRIRRPSRP